MSNFLLQKSFKLFQDNKQIKITKKTNLQKLKRKKNWIAVKKLKEEEVEENILRNLENIKKLNSKNSFDDSEKVLQSHIGALKSNDGSIDKEEEDSTAFTEKDFEEFEKEYLNS